MKSETSQPASWRAEEVETGLFKIIKLWIDGHVLVEFLAKGEVDRYIETFGPVGMASLDGKLRDLETRLAAVLSQKLSAEVLAKALGPGWRKGEA